ncbi:hypothetical protein D3C71_1440040 [compost metagenome]
MLSSATSAPMRPMLNLAADSARSRATRSLPSMAAAALITAERACSISSSRSAMRCCRAWKLPMRMPNCLRVRRYSSVAVLAASIAPSASAHSASTPRPMARSSVAAPWPSAPSSASAPSVTPSSVSSATRPPSIAGQPRTVRPAVLAGTRKSEMPASSSTLPEVRAETRNRSACSPCGTTALAPWSTQPSPRRSAVVATRVRS